MLVKLFNLYKKTLRFNLPKYPNSAPIRTITAMDIAQVKKPEENLVSSKNATRFKKRFMKRQWEDRPTEKEDGESAEKKTCDKPTERIKRKKMAMLLGYCGVDYYGMQRNPGVRTIEEELLKALLDAKYITEEDFKNQQNAHFQRSSRTDKGVSAAKQVVSLKLPLEIDIEEINKRLPENIKVFGVKRVTNKFNSKVKCNARTYSYTLPTYVFDEKLVSAEDRKTYRLTSEKYERINNVLECYKGTKSYHNFTEKKHHTDPSASRYMMGFSIDKVFIESEMEFAVLLVKGQSFMLHQIRKMVGLAIAIVRGHTDISIMEKAFSKEKVITPTAPGLGLVLDTVHYERYDNKFKGTHDSLTWEAEEETVQKFKREYIYPNIVKGEIEGNNMAEWLEKLQQHSYDPADHQAELTDDKAAPDDDDDDAADDDEELTDAKNDEKELNSAKYDGKVHSNAKDDEKELSNAKDDEKVHSDAKDDKKELINAKDDEKELSNAKDDDKDLTVAKNDENEDKSTNQSHVNGESINDKSESVRTN